MAGFLFSFFYGLLCLLSFTLLQLYLEFFKLFFFNLISLCYDFFASLRCILYYLLLSTLFIFFYFSSYSSYFSSLVLDFIILLLRLSVCFCVRQDVNK